MRTARFSDEEILEACREIAAEGCDPTYRTMRSRGIAVCGIRLRHLRDEAVRSGQLILPRNSRVLGHVIQPLLQKADARKPSQRRAGDCLIPQTPSQFMKIQRRVLSGPSQRDAYRNLKMQSVALEHGVKLWSFHYGTHKVPKWIPAVDTDVKSIKVKKASKPSGRQAQFDSVAG